MPVRCFLKKRLLIPTGCCLISFLMYGIAKGQPSENILWLTVETRHTVIRYQSLSDLNRFNSMIKYRTDGSFFSRLLSSSRAIDIATKVNPKIDALFERVQQILDMRKKIEKITINVYNDKKQLHEAYQRIYGQPCRVRAWYEYRFNSVFISVDDVNEGILAHEMAHGIIDHYFLVRPPPTTAEILARYVDSHL